MAIQKLKIRHIETRIGDSMQGADGLGVFDALQGRQRVEEKVRQRLEQQKLYDPASDVSLIITVNHFRLRHGATRFFTGMFSGSDSISALVEVEQQGKRLLSTSVKASGGNGNPFNISREARGTALFDAAAALIVRQIINTPIVDRLAASPAT